MLRILGKELSTKLSDISEGRVVKTQIANSGTSMGANYREANRARSKADFRSEIKKETLTLVTLNLSGGIKCL